MDIDYTSSAQSIMNPDRTKEDISRHLEHVETTLTIDYPNYKLEHNIPLPSTPTPCFLEKVADELYLVTLETNDVRISQPIYFDTDTGAIYWDLNKYIKANQNMEPIATTPVE